MKKPASDVEIRPAVAADAAGIRELTRAAYAKWVTLIGREPLPMQADYEQALREHEIDLLTIGGDLAGLIETILHRDHLWIENVAVAPERQGRGYGRLLLAHAERRATEASAAKSACKPMRRSRPTSRSMRSSAMRSTGLSRSAAGRLSI